MYRSTHVWYGDAAGLEKREHYLGFVTGRKWLPSFLIHIVDLVLFTLSTNSWCLSPSKDARVLENLESINNEAHQGRPRHEPNQFISIILIIISVLLPLENTGWISYRMND